MCRLPQVGASTTTGGSNVAMAQDTLSTNYNIFK